MDVMRLVAIALIVFGVLGLVYGSFSFTTNIHREHIGSINWTVNDRQTVYIPVGVGVAAVLAGAVLLLLSKRN